MNTFGQPTESLYFQEQVMLPNDDVRIDEFLFEVCMIIDHFNADRKWSILLVNEWTLCRSIACQQKLG